MAKFIKRDATTGRATEELTVSASAGVGSAGRVPELDAGGKLDQSMMPSGLGADTASVTASEALAAGDYVNIWDNAGATRVRKADANTLGKPADGFVLAAVAAAAVALVYLEGQNNQHTGLVGGTRYYLSATVAGGVTAVPVIGTGKTHQYIGKAINPTTLGFEADETIDLA